MIIFIRRVNLLPCYLLFRSILRREARRGSERYGITSRTWCHGLSLISNTFLIAPIRGANVFILLIFFIEFSAIQAEFILDYWNKSERPDRPNRLRAFPYDRFSNFTRSSWLSRRSRSSPSSGSFAIVRVAFPYDLFDRLNIRDLKQQDHGRDDGDGKSVWSLGQDRRRALLTWTC